MSKKDEALKLALEALEWNLPVIEDWGGKDNLNLQHRAITAIREALAEQPAQPIKQGWDVDTLLNKPKQPAQQPYDTHAAPGQSFDTHSRTPLTQQEPVAWINHNRNLLSWDKFFDDMEPLYTSPPASKPWVGLTDEERGQAINANFGTGLWAMAKDIEAKLREKNA